MMYLQHTLIYIVVVTRATNPHRGLKPLESVSPNQLDQMVTRATNPHRGLKQLPLPALTFHPNCLVTRATNPHRGLKPKVKRYQTIPLKS